MHRTLIAALAFAGAAFASQASAQNLTTENVASAFIEGVSVCAKAKKADVAVAALSPADLALLSPADQGMRDFLHAAPGRPVWNVERGRGIVAIVEATDRQCAVYAYGPRVAPVFERVGAALSAAELGFHEEPVEQTPSAILREFMVDTDHGLVHVRLDGGEPGMPGRTFRFPLLIAYVQVVEGDAQ